MPRTRLGRLIRNISRRIAGRPELQARFAHLLDLAGKARYQDQRQRSPKVYSLHAPEVECVGKGKAGAPMSPLQSLDRHACDRAQGQTFLLHAKALHGNPCGGYTPGSMCRVGSGAPRRMYGWKKMSQSPAYTTYLIARAHH